MSCARELEQIARDLISGNRWFKGNNVNVLQAFIRDGGCCVYCGTKLWDVFGVASCGDHLLPKSVYPDLAENVDNLVPACADCNSLKRDFDPSERKGMERAITEEIRLEFVRRAKEKIEERRNSDDWRNEFKVAKPLFDGAVAKYRGCLVRSTEYS